MKRKLVAAAGVVLVLAAAGCSSSGNSGGGSGSSGSSSSGTVTNTVDSVFGKYGNMTAAQRDPELLKLAQATGGITVYTGWTNAQKMTDAFTKKYGIKVSLYNPDTETMLQKFLQEQQGGKQTADIVDTDYIDALQAQNQRHLFYEGWTPNNALPPSNDLGSKALYFTRAVAYVTVWNTKLVKPDQVPTSFQDLENPKWKGKMAVETTDQEWYAALATYYESQGMSQDDVLKMFQAVFKNARAVKGHTNIGNLMAAGEFEISPTLYTQTVSEETSKGAPLAYLNSDNKTPVPIVINPDATGFPKNAKNPAGALLYSDFMLSQQGQQILKDNGAVPPAKSMQDFGDSVTVLTPVDKLLAGNELQNEFTQLIAGVSK